MTRPRVAAIVPAYNESVRVCAVLEAISGASLIDEIVVVTDGCSDDTAPQVRAWMESRASAQPQVKLFELTQNIGKGGAMTYGAHRTDAEIILFLDADLIGLRAPQVDDLVQPLLRAEHPVVMTLGLFGAVRGGLFGWWLGVCHRTWPKITGQRAIVREVFLAVPRLTHSRYGVETLITRFVENDPHLNLEYVYLHNVTHPIKEEKMGPVRGFATRVRMYSEIYLLIGRDSLQDKVEHYREEALRLRGRFENK